MEILNIQEFINNPNITVGGLRVHSKASEKYVDVVFRYADQDDWIGSIPYFYRRTGLFLETEKEVAELIEKAYESLKTENSKKWIETEKKLW